MVGPFIFLDHGGPVKLAPEKVATMDVLPHPHIGLSTVTYLLDGQITHRDSLGVEQIIKPGEVNWMTAGRGISHSERFENPDLLAKGGLEMLQSWVALPENAEENAPEFFNYKSDELAVYTDKGIWLRLIAGNAYGLKNNVKTYSPLFYIHAQIDRNTKFTLPTEHSERAMYIVTGGIELSNTVYKPGQMVVFKKEEQPTLLATEDSTIMLMGGEPLGERFIWWNFVSSRKERIEQAKEDWKAGRILLPPNDNEVFVPLPETGKAPIPKPPLPDIFS
jgi:redox-sensitive bicupin YhaK (pirin superfamily)